MKLVLCEGKDDIAVVEGLCLHSKITGLNLEEYKGRDRLPEVVCSLPIRPEFARGELESLAILIDAEKDRDASFQKVRDLVKKAFDVVVAKPGVFAGSKPRVAGFVVCDDSGRGMLEDVCLKSVSGRADHKCMEEYFKCLSEKMGRKDFHPKAKFKAWLASQIDFNIRAVGLAATGGYLPWENEAFDDLREFLKNV
jgi:hypothetical protein